MSEHWRDRDEPAGSGITVYCDQRSDEILAERYLQNGPLPGVSVVRLPTVAHAPAHLRPLLTWERLDWVLTRGTDVCCTVEFSRHGYTGDHCFQRFARLFRSASLGIPTIYFTPFSRTRINELDEGRESPRNVAPELFQTLELMEEEFEVSCLAVDWPSGPTGTPLPLSDPAAVPSLSTLCNLVADLIAVPSSESRAHVAAHYPQLRAAMERQASIPFRGTATRGRLTLPVDVTRPDWVIDWLPDGYFGFGKADKVLALLALNSCKARPIVGQGERFWERAGDAWVLFLGYQWRPDPASGLIALASAQAKRQNLPLVVVWPRIFLKDNAARQRLLEALCDFQAGRSPTIARELESLGRSAVAVEAFRRRVSAAASQFGLYAPETKAPRILSETAQTLVLGDAVLAIGP